VRRIIKAAAFALLAATCAAPTALFVWGAIADSVQLGCEEVMILVACLFGLKWAFEAAAKARRIWGSKLPANSTDGTESS
jgi:hypothetical protein